MGLLRIQIQIPENFTFSLNLIRMSPLVLPDFVWANKAQVILLKCVSLQLISSSDLFENSIFRFGVQMYPQNIKFRCASSKKILWAAFYKFKMGPRALVFHIRRMPLLSHLGFTLFQQKSKIDSRMTKSCQPYFNWMMLFSFEKRNW